MPRWKVKLENCNGDQYQDVLCWKVLFRTQSHTCLHEWNLLRRSKAKPWRILGQANFDIVKSQGIFINPWDSRIPYILRESKKVPWWKVEPENCSGDQYQDMLCFSMFQYLIVSFSRELACACLSSSQCFNGNAQTYINRNVKIHHVKYGRFHAQKRVSR